MEYINYLNNNRLIWDDKYFDIYLTSDEINYNLETIATLMVKIANDMNSEIIDTRFYYVGKYIAKIIKNELTYTDGNNKLYVLIYLDMFLTFEEIFDFDIFDNYSFGENIKVKSVWEYFILSRALIKYDIQACIPFMHKVDVNNTDILKYYEEVRDRIYLLNNRGSNTKSAKK